MSDTSQGDGWWIASDGKWYAPEQHPDYQPPPPPPPAPALTPPPAPAPVWPAPPPAPLLAEQPPVAPNPQQPVGGRDGRPAWRKPWLLAVLAVAAVMVVLVVVVALGGDDDDGAGEEATRTDEPDEQPAQDQAGAEPDEASDAEAAEATADQATPAPTPTEPPPDREGSIDAPLPLSPDGAASVEYRPGFGSDTEWEVSMTALVSTPVDEFEEEPGECYLAFMSLTPTAIGSGPMTNLFDVPSVNAIAERQMVESFGSCDSNRARELGHRGVFDVALTPGTTASFFVPIFIAGDPAPPIDYLVLGDPRGDDAVYFEPTLTEAIPAAVNTAGPLLSDGEALRAVGVDSAPIEFSEDFSDSQWQVQIHGYVEASVGDFVEEAGRCFIVLGALTPTTIGGGGAISNAFDAPQVSLVVGGRIDTSVFGDCATDAVEAAGYGSRFDATVTAGTAYRFYEPVFVPDTSSDAEPEAILVGSPGDDQAVVSEAQLLDNPPA